MHTLVASPAVVGPDALVLGFAVDENNPQRVMAVGGQHRDFALLSDDGGRQWRQLSSPGKGLRGAFIDGDVIWIAGEYGFVARSTDNGHSWQLFDVGFVGCIFGVTRDEHGAIIIAGDGGFIAACREDVSFKLVTGIKVSLSRLYKCGAGIFIPTDAPGDVVHVASVVAKGETKPKATLRKIDIGGDLMTVTQAPGGTMLVVGVKGEIRRSTDLGVTWTASTSPTTAMLAGVCALASGRFVAVGAGGTVIVSDDDGVSFTTVNVSVGGRALWACVAVGEEVLFAGAGGAVFRLHTVAVPTTAAELPAPQGVRGVVPGIFVDDELRRMVFQWRGGTIAAALPALPAVDDAWQVVRREMWTADRLRARHHKRATETWQMLREPRASRRRLAARLYEAQVAIGSFVDDVVLVAAAMSDDFAGADDRPRDNALVDLLVAQHGVVATVQRVFAALTGELRYSRMGVFERLRERVVTSSAADYAAVLALALPALDGVKKSSSYDRYPVAVTNAWAFILPISETPHDVEIEVQRRALHTIGKFGDTDIASPGLLASVDHDGFNTFIKNNPQARHEFFAGGERPYLATLLARGTAALLEYLPSMRPSYDLSVDVWGLLLAHIDNERVLRLLTSDPKLAAGASVAAALDPQRFFAFIQNTKASSDDVTALQALLATATASLPPSPTIDGASLGTPDPGNAPLPLPPSPLVVHGALMLDPELTWREDERAAAEPGDGKDRSWPWQPDDAVDVASDRKITEHQFSASSAVQDHWLALRELHRVPTEMVMYVLLPTRLHPRLLALGALPGETGAWRHHRAALLKNIDVIDAVRAYIFDDSVDLHDRLTTVLPLGDVHAVPAVVTAFGGKKHKPLARAWILRHPRHAAAGALAMVATEVDADNAARVLRFVDGLGHRTTIVQLARGVSSDLVARVQVLLDEDPMAQPGVKAPTLPAWAKAAALPNLVDVDGTAWTAERTDALLLRMAASNPDEINPVITAARLSLTKAAAAALSRALFEAWLTNDANPKQSFAMHALGFFGDDDGIRRLATLARAWPGESAAARAQTALDTLVLHGGDSALLQLAVIGEKSKFAAFKKGAGERIVAIADTRGLTADELADRLVPTLGLNDDGATVLDFGSRTFSVTFDESLAPRVKDGSGVLLKDLPKPNKSDDADLAAASKKKLSALKKDVKAVADLLLRRLERMMIDGRAVDVDTFRTSFVEHPLTFHVARRLLWEAIDPNGTRVSLFRIAEDRTFADLKDTTWSLPRGARVRVVHPLDLDDASLAAGSTLWGDYELLQPFAQLGRAVHRLATPDTATSTSSMARAGKTAPAPTLVYGLDGRQWQRDDIGDGGSFTSHTKRFGDVRAVVNYDGAVGMGYIEPNEQLTLGGIAFSDRKSRRVLCLGDVPARVLSEVVLDLDMVLTK